MKKSEIKIGSHYHAKVSGRLTTVRVDAIESLAPMNSAKKAYGAKTRTAYRCVNLSTMRTVVFRSAQKFLREATVIPIAEKAQTWREEMDEGNQEASIQALGYKALQEQENPVPTLKLADKLKASATNLPPHVIVKALAGTGKTTTLIEGLKAMSGLTVSITPSPQQAAVWEAMELSKGASACFVAFNKSIATELQRRVPSGVQAMTMHSMGFKGVQAAFGRVRVTEWRTEDIIAEIIGRDLKDIKREDFEMVSATKKLVSMCKNNLTNAQGDAQFNWEEALLNLADYYDIEMNGSAEKVIDLVPQVLHRCKDVDRDRSIDFDDMVWLPVSLGLPMSKYDVLLVDESQDLNRSRQALAKMCGHRLVLCGDEHQAIYGFAGADASSMARMEEELTATPQGCVVLPLTVTRRCGKAIVEEAKAIVPEFEAHESNGEGTISRRAYKGQTTSHFELWYSSVYWNNHPDSEPMLKRGVKYPTKEAAAEQFEIEYPEAYYYGSDGSGRKTLCFESRVFSFNPDEALAQIVEVQSDSGYQTLAEPGDMCLCRVNAPLVSQCLQFLKEGRKAEIQGRDVGQGLITTIKKVCKTTGQHWETVDVGDLTSLLEKWVAAETEKELKKRNPSDARLIALEDRFSCIVCFAEDVNTAGEVAAKIEAVFTDNPNSPGVKFSTIHKAKGLEADRVFFLEPEGAQVPHPMAKSSWQREQEYNLRYVAITRAIKELVYVK